MNRRERREDAASGLVIKRSLGPGAATGVVAREEERAGPLIGEGRSAQLVAAREEELERAVCVGARGRDVEAKDGRHVVRREMRRVLRPVRLVRVLSRHLRDVMRVLVLPSRQVAGTSCLLVVGPFSVGEGTL